MSTRFGACVARARLHARFGSPMPTNTTSPSRSSRAATAVIISSALYGASVAIVHAGGHVAARLEPRGELRLLRHVLRAIAHAEHDIAQIRVGRGRIARDRFPSDVEIVVAVVVALRVARM